MIKKLSKIVNRLSLLAGWVAAGMIVLSVLVVCEMVFVRYIMRGSVIWQTEFVTYLLIAATLIGSPYVLQTKGHVNVDILAQYLKPRARFITLVLATVIALAFCLVATWSGYHTWYEAWSNNWKSETIWGVRLWIPYAALPVGFGLLSLQYSVEFLEIINRRQQPVTSKQE